MSFDPFTPFAGGLLLGLGGALLLLLNGKMAGISGIYAGLLRPAGGEFPWRVAFIAGMASGGLVLSRLRPEWFEGGVTRSVSAIALAGVLVGFGTRLGNGCTSGHGLCGLSRGSRRALAATMTFMATGAASTFVINHLLGGSL